MTDRDRGGLTDPLFPAPGVAPLSPAQVADLIETLTAARSLLARESRALAGSPVAISTGTIDRLTRLAAALRPGAAARVTLATIPPQLLMDGVTLLLGRGRRAPSPPPPAAVRAQRRWTRRPGP